MSGWTHLASTSRSSPSKVSRCAQLRIASGCNQLLGLDKELDLTNATSPQFHIMPFQGDHIMAPKGMDLPFHGMDIGDSRIIQIFAPDEGRNLTQRKA